MLTVSKPRPNHLEIELSGTLDAETMRAGLDDLLAKSADINSGTMLYRIPGFAMPTLGAVGVEMGYLPKLFSLIGRFDRCAVCTDAAWLRAAAEVEGALLPGLVITGFALDETKAAAAWLEAAA